VRNCALRRQHGLLLLPVDALECAGFGIGHHLRPQFFSVADHHGVGMLQCFIGEESRVVAAHHHRHPTPAKFGADFVGPAGGVGFNGHRNQVGGVLRVYRLDPFIVQRRFDMGWRMRGKHRECQRLHRVAGARGCHIRANECNFHKVASRQV